MAILLVFYPTHKKRNQDNFHIKLLLKVSFSALMSVNDHFKHHSIKKGLIVSWRAFNMRKLMNESRLKEKQVVHASVIFLSCFSD